MYDLINLLYGFGYALLLLGAFIVGMGILAFLVSYVFDYKNIRDEMRGMGTSVGNALLVLHSFFEPGRKPQTEQVIKIKKRRTPIEKKVSNLTGISYYNIYISGVRQLKNKRYFMVKPKN